MRQISIDSSPCRWRAGFHALASPLASVALALLVACPSVADTVPSAGAADAPGSTGSSAGGAAAVTAARSDLLAPLWWLPVDPAKVVGPGDCGECHAEAHGVWEETAHAKGFRTLARSDAARAIADALDVRRIKREPSCVGCHFLPSWDDDDPAELVPVAGVACESCHGASADWIDVHSDLGPGSGDETPEHRTKRLAASHAAGMRGPATLHELASSCYACHVVPDASVVDGSRHPVSPDFDLLTATQGTIRHNFLRGGGENAKASPEHARLLLALGRLLDLEWSLRGLAHAPPGGRQAEAMAARVERARAGVAELTALAPLPELEAALAATTELPARATDGALGTPGALREAAEAVAAAGAALARRGRDGDAAALGPLQPLVDAR